ncbi:uncharacterized protein GJ701_017101 [Geothlypis trichas]
MMPSTLPVSSSCGGLWCATAEKCTQAVNLEGALNLQRHRKCFQVSSRGEAAVVMAEHGDGKEEPAGLEQVEYHMFPKGKQLLRNQHVNLLLRGLVPRRVNISASRPLGRACDSSLAFKAVQRQSCQIVLSTGMKVEMEGTARDDAVRRPGTNANIAEIQKS